MLITIAQLNYKVGDFEGNRNLICNAIDKADTITMGGDYMLDSNDCIAVVRVMQALLSVRGITAKAEGAKP